MFGISKEWSSTPLTSMFPIVWNDVNKNMNPNPRISTFTNFVSMITEGIFKFAFAQIYINKNTISL